MPRLRDLLRRNNEREISEANSSMHEPQYGASYNSWTRLDIDPIPLITEPSREEPEIFNEERDYPEDTPEAIRIRLANLEEIERGLEEDERRNSLYYDSFILEAPNRCVLRTNDQYVYGVTETIFTADRDMVVNEYPSHSRDNNYHPVISDTEEISDDGTPYTVRTIRYEPNPALGGIPFGGLISPPIITESVYGVPFISAYGVNTNQTASSQSPYTDTDVGYVIPNTRYGTSAGVRT